MITEQTISERYSEIVRKVETAAQRAGRNPSQVTVVAVTKTWPREVVETALRTGIVDIGENRIQEAEEKLPGLPGSGRYHLVGHLQRNKAKKAARLFDVIHSVDSMALGSVLSSAADALGKHLDLLVQVNVAGDSAKAGIDPQQARLLIRELNRLPGIRTIGLMTIGPLFDDPEDGRQVFRALRVLRDELRNEFADLTHLSMGMTADYEIAVEEGATMVRIGTALFGHRT